MAKAFLSHSSVDKPVVEQVVENLNAAEIHYDALTFENGVTSAQNIFNALGETDIFVLFVSKNSLKSTWVETEISMAEANKAKKIIKSLLVFIIDETPYSALPHWIGQFTATRLKSPKIIALKIASRLLELNLEVGKLEEVYIGRDDTQAALKSMLTAPVEETPVAICASGWHGIGRRTILKKVLSESFPWLPRLPPVVHLRDEDGAPEFYRAVLEYSDSRTADEWQIVLHDFDSASYEEQIALLVDSIKKLSSLRQVLIVRGDYAVVSDSGDFQPWLRDVLLALPRKNIPHICLACSRRVPLRLQDRYKKVGFVSLRSLSRDDSRQLLGALMKGGETPVSASFLDAAIPIVSGHPLNIKVASEFALRIGPDAFLARSSEFSSLFTERANRLVDMVLEDQKTSGPLHLRLKRTVLKLFSDFEYLTLDELLSFFDKESIQKVSELLKVLEDFGVIEWEGHFFRMAPFVQDAVGRAPWEKETAELRRHAAQHLIEVASRYTDDAGVRLSVVNNASLALVRAVASGQTVVSASSRWLQAVALPSHYLRVAREMYDARRERTAIDLTTKCLAFEDTVTPAARIEALRLKAMCHARLGENDYFITTVRALEHISGKVARRNALFLRGFKARKEGNFDHAEKYYRQAYALDTRNFHVLRELSHVLLAQDRFEDARIYAQAAVDRHPYHSYALDSLVGARMGILKAHEMRSDAELEELFIRLEEASAADNTSFFDIRRAYYYMHLGIFSEAVAHAEKAKQRTPNLFSALAAVANVRLAAGDAKLAVVAIREIDRLTIDERTGEGKDQNQLAKLRVKLALLRGDVQAARNELDRSRISNIVRANLARAIADANARLGVGDQD